MRKVVTGEQVAQLRNPDPFAIPQWRSPVYRTPGWIVALAQLARGLWLLIRLLARHPIATIVTAFLVWLYVVAGWPALVILASSLIMVLAVWRWRWPGFFSRRIAAPARARWRGWHYRRRWAGVMTISGLAPVYQTRLLLPVLGKVTTTRHVDRVGVRLVSGQSPKDFADSADNLAHGFGAILCRIRSAKSGRLVLEFVRKDALAVPIPALPIPSQVNFSALPVGRCEDGSPWLIRLRGTHVLLAGSTGAGKASLIWGMVRAMLPALIDGTARVWGADPKLMELAFGKAIFEKYGRYAATAEDVAAMLEDAVAEMHDRAAGFAGEHREHIPTAKHPFIVIFIDETAFLTAYHPDKALRDRVKAALATLTTQGRAVGFCVVAALQDPRKEVMNIRNLFPDRIVMRLDEADQVDLVLGPGARDRGALADLISLDPTIGAGVAYVRLHSHPDPVRVRAGWVTDADIKAMTRLIAPAGGLRAVEGGEAA
jgi:DNA segregation ATPase FtsK/SpoIIIE, S-DNA-T family